MLVMVIIEILDTHFFLHTYAKTFELLCRVKKYGILTKNIKFYDYIFSYEVILS